ncbi:DNA internalization-related competence protein ComEC/Rec2 [Streptococcus loxodontisalivarius]|uniref:Competence protein ComEC n=1 Tax=Streptococcus loxodontisalivarius TaxID=1349415 RepID=A0ABS2PTE5_9STRE|nr:DNA internalization-related competence protein ComEC/Rec2 [Streptococcus loxodontisalivarius]MBM7643161.1 competence protein ComEC [Streptococcus loxodontisalivarius]
MTDFLPIKPIYLAYLAVLVSFLIFSWNVWTLGLFLFSLLAILRQYSWQRSFKTLAILLVFSLYLFGVNSCAKNKEKDLPEEVTQVQMIADSISVNGDRLSFRARSAGQTYQAYYQIKTEEEQTFFKNLDKTLLLEVEAGLEEPAQQRNFHGFDYRRYLKFQGIYAILQVSDIKSIKQASGIGFWDSLADLRRKLIVHSQKTFPQPMSHYMTGLLFGYLDKSFEEMSDLYSDLGIIHLFALSGMQVAFFMGLWRRFLVKIGLTLDWINWLMLPTAILYAGLTGLTISVIRALLQILLAQLGLRKWDNFAASLGLMFLFMPYFLMTTGGMLSFAYAFILTLLDFEGILAWRKSLLEVLSINMGILPILTWTFATFQPLAIPLTAIFSLIFDYFLLPFLTLAFALSPLLVLDFVNPLFELLESSLLLLGKVTGGAWVFGASSLALTFLALLSLGFLSDRRFWKKGVLYLLLGLCLLGNKHPLENEVTVIDVGQGDSIFLRDMTGKTILIDVGGKVSFSEKEEWQKGLTDANAERTSIPYLKSRGVSKIDQLVLTHTDSDHIGDLEVFLEEIDVGEILVSQGSLTVPDFVARLRKLKKPVKVLSAGQTLSIMGSQLQVLYPQTTGDGGNNDSIVLYGKLLNKRFLFTGDLEKEGEEALMTTYAHLPVDILKAGHHGSKGSSSPEFLDFIAADVALVSAGQDNRYQHPHQETLERFEERQMTVYRTDQMGAIRFRGWQTWTLETVR